jgi:hypothetical protein
MASRRARAAIAAVAVATLILSLAAQAADRPTFDLRTDEFWLNLHKFLYVLGQSQGRQAGGRRRSVRDRPA